MSFFGFNTDLENEKRTFVQGGLQESEDLAVYNWGEEIYDGLGDSLQERGDDLNDETFGDVGEVGKDFDFAHPSFPESQTRSGPNDNSTGSIWANASSFGFLDTTHARPNSNGVHKSSEIYAADDTRPASPGGGHGGYNYLHGTEPDARRTTPGQSLVQEEDVYYLTSAEHRERDILRQEAIYQQELLLQQAQIQQQQILHQQRVAALQARNTPPPRMHSSPLSSRYTEQQERQLYLLQQQEQQELLRMQELQEQLRMEGLERQLRAQHISHSPIDIQQLQQDHFPQRSLQTHGQDSFDIYSSGTNINPDNRSHIPYNRHLQQRILNEVVHGDALRGFQGSLAEQEALRVEAMRKILETEKMEERRRRKAAKIAHMARYNELMTQSDKDFITRIQVSQLVTQDPYADDFYAQVYGALIRSRSGVQSQDERVLKFGSGLGVGLGIAQKGANRRQNAMQRMEQQVERIVSNARKREEEKGQHSVHSLQGALGKTSGRSYKAAPRQLLQVRSSSPTSSLEQVSPQSNGQSFESKAAAHAARLGREALGNVADTTDLVRRDPLTSRQILITLEKLWDLVLQVEQLRRDQPPLDDEEGRQHWRNTFEDLVDQIWNDMKIMVPVATSNPHPFISLLSSAKGKRIIPRVVRHLDDKRALTMLTLLIACFSQLDVVIGASILDSFEDSAERSDVDRQTTLFSSCVIQSLIPTIAKGGLQLMTGLLGLFLDRNDILMIARTQPGLSLLRLFISRVEILKHEIASISATSGEEVHIPEALDQWQVMFDHLFQLLSADLPSLFPSTRINGRLQPGQIADISTDALDQPVWKFLSTLALHASPEQHQVLVTALREKVLDDVLSVKNGWNLSEDDKRARLTNVNLFLNTLGLDVSQITM